MAKVQKKREILRDSNRTRGSCLNPEMAQFAVELQSNVIQFSSLARNMRYHLTSNETASIL